MSRDYRFGRPSIQRIHMGIGIKASYDDEQRYAVQMAIRCPVRFNGCREHGIPVHRRYWNGYREVKE